MHVISSLVLYGGKARTNLSNLCIRRNESRNFRCYFNAYQANVREVAAKLVES